MHLITVNELVRILIGLEYAHSNNDAINVIKKAANHKVFSRPLISNHKALLRNIAPNKPFDPIKMLNIKKGQASSITLWAPSYVAGAWLSVISSGTTQGTAFASWVTFFEVILILIMLWYICDSAGLSTRP